MKNKSLLPILLLAAFSLSACNLPNSKSSEAPKDESSVPAEVSSDEPVASSDQPTTSEDPVQYGVAINNKAALQGEWYADTTRDLDVTLTPAANALQELNKGNLTVQSSDPTVVAVTGLGLKSLKAGTATITVKYHDATDTVAVTILDNSAKAKYGVAHEGTAADPFTNEDALVVAKHEKYEKEVYYVKGIVDRFYYAPGTNQNNGTAFYLKAATEGGEQFEIFKCFKEDGSQLSDDDIWVGGEATVYGAFTKYNSQYETSSAVFVSCTGTKPQPRQTLEKTFAETLAAGVALADGDTTWDFYKFQGFVTAKEGNNFFLTATKGEALTKAKSDAAHGEKDYYTNAIELYNAGKVAELVAKLLEGAKVEVTMLVKNYHGTVENGKDLVDADVTVVEAGQNWAVPEPAVGSKTIEEFKALENTKAKAYMVEGVVKDWNGADAEKSKYGNMTLTDGTNDLVIYGASATATALAWDNSSAYAFTNPKDFLTNEVTAALNIGDTVKMKLIRADYNGAIQGTGVITKVTPAGQQTNETTLEFSFAQYATDNNVAGGTQVKTIAANDVVTLEAVGTDSNTGKIYVGDTYTEWRFYKSGTGTLKITVASGYELVSAKGAVGTANYGAPTDVEFTVADNKVEYNPGANFNVKSLEIVYKPAGGEQPQPEIAQPTGEFHGVVKLIAAAGGALQPVDMYLTADSVSLYINGAAVTVSSYQWDKTAGSISIVTSGDYGTVTAVFDADKNAFSITGVTGANGAYIDNNYVVTLHGNALFYNCDGTTEELQAIFGRRYYRSGTDANWVNDTSNADRVSKSENPALQGSSLKLRPISAGASNRVALTLANDFTAARATTTVSFWVYNSGASDVTLRAWGYTKAAKAENFEYVNIDGSGSMVAKAGQWTFITMTFYKDGAAQTKNIFNFQIADMNSTQGETLYFDNICLL